MNISFIEGGNNLENDIKELYKKFIEIKKKGWIESKHSNNY